MRPSKEARLGELTTQLKWNWRRNESLGGQANRQALAHGLAVLLTGWRRPNGFEIGEMLVRAARGAQLSLSLPTVDLSCCGHEWPLRRRFRPCHETRFEFRPGDAVDA